MIQDCNEAIRRNSRNAASYQNRAASLYRKGEFARAVDDATQAISLNDRLVDAWFTRCEALIALKRLEEAHADAMRLLKIAPKAASSHLSCGGTVMGQKAPRVFSQRMTDPSPC